MPETSIVVRSFNEAKYIEDVLEAVSEQRYQDFELVLIDSGSTDGTLQIAESYVDKIEFVAPHDFTFGHSCNVGCEAADGRFVAFLSAHAIPTDDRWLGRLVDNLRDESVAMTYSNQTGADVNKFSEQRLFDELFPAERKRQTPPDYFANNASSAIKRRLWEEYQFDEYLTGHEDIDWAKHFMDEGYVVEYEPDACIYHIHEETWTQVYNRFKREAIADMDIGIRDRSDRWREYVAVPVDIVGDLVAAARGGELDTGTATEIAQFRYNQHVGTAAGLKSERNLESNRFEYFYDSVNERVVVDAEGNARVERSPLPELKPNDVLVRVEYVGVSPDDSDPGTFPKSKYPIVPGQDYVGTVMDLGANADGFDVGDAVVGGTVFDCGICPGCANDGECRDPTRLGVDTDDGAYSRFVAVPSDHVYRLGEDADVKTGALVGTLGYTLKGLGRAEQLVAEPGTSLVVGDTPHARLVTQLLGKDGWDIEQVDRPRAGSCNTYDFVVDTTGDEELIQNLIGTTAPETVVLLLGGGEGDLTLSLEDFSDRILITVTTGDAADVDSVLARLPEVETDALFDGTYALDEYESAWAAAAEQSQFPVIAVHEGDSTPDAGDRVR